MIVLITGASSGIGRATALACAARGDSVVLASRSEHELTAVAEKCRSLGGAALVVPVEVSDEESVRRMVSAAQTRFGRVDAVVHSAAVVAYGHFEDLPTRVFDRVIQTNVLGTANVARATLRSFRDSGHGGTMVLLGSLLGDVAMPLMSPYVTSKWAVHGLARALRIEARRLPGVQVALVAPAGIRTPIYLQAANYLGRAGRPPSPAYSVDKVARSILSVLDRPRRKKRVGSVNWLVAFGFRLLPAAHDALATPYMRVGGLSRRRVPPHEGNLFSSLAATMASPGDPGG